MREVRRKAGSSACEHIQSVEDRALDTACMDILEADATAYAGRQYLNSGAAKLLVPRYHWISVSSGVSGSLRPVRHSAAKMRHSQFPAEVLQPRPMCRRAIACQE